MSQHTRSTLILRRLPAALFVAGCILGVACTALLVGRGREVVILAINDVYRIGAVDGGERGGLPRVRALRMELERLHPDLLVLHAGDLLFPSVMSRSTGGAHMIQALNRLDGRPGSFDRRMIAVFGNHEFDEKGKDGAVNLSERVQGSEFAWLRSNVRFLPLGKEPALEGPPLEDTVLVTSGGVQVGLFGLTIDAKKPDYVAFERPLDVARDRTERLRQAGAELVIALTHLEMGQDLALLRALGDQGPDLILGGHEHQAMSCQENGRWVLKADADARSANVVRVRLRGAQRDVRFETRALRGSDPVPDPVLAQAVQDARRAFEEKECSDKKVSDCLSRRLARAGSDLIAAEADIRGRSTNLGNWVADQARGAFDDADIAFLNAGGLRLNEDIRKGDDFTGWDLEGLFAYPPALVLVRLTGAELRGLLEHAVVGWPGNGRWLQVSGFSFQFDTKTGEILRLERLTDAGPVPIEPEQELRAATISYLYDDKGDGFVFPPGSLLTRGSQTLDEIVREALVALEAQKTPLVPPGDTRIVPVGGPPDPCTVAARI
jgi:2',3'-cyclic-nucleotide 2'-phosphodiesterase (5'-nucleotidase family)